MANKKKTGGSKRRPEGSGKLRTGTDSAPGSTPEAGTRERSEGVTGGGGLPGAGASVPDPEVSERATRRRFTAKYKLGVVDEADACSEPGEVGALLRREGLYSSHLTQWRRARDAGALKALSSVKRGRKGKSRAQRDADQLRRENARLKRELARAELMLEIQKKVSELLDIPLNQPEPDDFE